MPQQSIATDDPAAAATPTTQTANGHSSFPDKPRNDAVEIRIHGVSGTSPQELLGCAEVRQVAGDRIAGFYQPVQPDQLRDGGPAGPLLEGYSWGGWTSGGPTRALWIALLPFALINVAARMLPPTKLYDKTNPNPSDKDRMGVDWKHRGITSAIRILSLSMTITAVFGIGQIAMITIGRRCAEYPNVDQQGALACYGLPIAVTDWLRGFSHSWQLGLSALIPMLAVGLIWRLSTKSTHRYEDVQPEVDIDTTVRPDDDTLPLGRRDLWRGSRRIRLLRLLHVQAAFATIAVMLSGIFPWQHSAPAVILAVATLAVTVALVSYRPANQTRRLMLFGRLNWILLGLSGVAVLWMLISAAGDQRWPADPDRMVGTMNGWYLGLFGVQLTLLAVVFVLLVALAAVGRKRVTRMHMHGYGAVVFAFLGCLTGAMFNAGVLILAPIWLFTDSFVIGQGDITAFLQDHPGWFGWTTLSAGYGIVAGLVLLLLVLLPFLVLAIRVFWFGTPTADVAHVDAQYSDIMDVVPSGVRDQVKRYVTEAAEDVEKEQHDRERRARQIQRDFWLARRVDYAPLAIWALVIGLAAVLLVQVVEWLSGGAFHLLVAEETSGAATVRLPDLLAWGAYFAVLGLIGVIGLAAASYRKAGTRRGVGVLWDLTCFWPRDVHPFAPPCYTERIVPEVSTRMATHLAKPHESNDNSMPAVVVAAHSQGTVISMAVLLAQPPVFQMDRVGLLTCGTVLDRLYARFFPRYFSAAAFEQLSERLGGPNQVGADPQVRWINLWRYSDYLGGVVPYESAGQERKRLAPLGGTVGSAVAAIHAAIHAAECAITAANSALQRRDAEIAEADLLSAAGLAVQRAVAAAAAGRQAAGSADTAVAAIRTSVGVRAGKEQLPKLWTADDAPGRAQAANAASLAAADAVAARVRNAESAAAIAGLVVALAEQYMAMASAADKMTGLVAASSAQAIGAAKEALDAARAAAASARAAASAAQRAAKALTSADPQHSIWPENTALVDPAFRTPAGDIIAPRANRHSYFWTDPAFGSRVHDLVTRVEVSGQRAVAGNKNAGSPGTG